MAIGATYARGSVVLATRSVTFNAMRLRAPWVRDAAIETGRQHPGSKAWHPAAHTKTEKGFFTFRVDHQEGTVIMLGARATRGGVTYSEGTLFVRLREAAAPLRVNLALPVAAGLTILGDSFTVFQGRGDIMQPDELRILGFQIPQRFQEVQCNAEEIAELFDWAAIGQGEPKPTFQATTTSAGEVRVIATAERPVRGIRRRS